MANIEFYFNGAPVGDLKRSTVSPGQFSLTGAVATGGRFNRVDIIGDNPPDQMLLSLSLARVGARVSLEPGNTTAVLSFFLHCVPLYTTPGNDNVNQLLKVVVKFRIISNKWQVTSFDADRISVTTAATSATGASGNVLTGGVPLETVTTWFKKDGLKTGDNWPNLPIITNPQGTSESLSSPLLIGVVENRTTSQSPRFYVSMTRLIGFSVPTSIDSPWPEKDLAVRRDRYLLTQYQRYGANEVDLQTASIDPPTQWVLKISALQFDDVIEFWNTSISQRYGGALNQVQAGRPTSLMPTLDPLSEPGLDKPFWTLAFPLRDEWTGLTAGGPANLLRLEVVNDKLPSLDNRLELLPPYLYQAKLTPTEAGLLNKNIPIPNRLGQGSKLQVRFQRFKNTQGRDLTFEARFFPSEKVDFEPRKAPIELEFDLEKPDPSSRAATVGSLDIEFTGNGAPPGQRPPAPIPGLQMQVSFARPAADQAQPTPDSFIPIIDRLEVIFPVARALPGGQADLVEEQYVPDNAGTTAEVTAKDNAAEIERNFQLERPLVIPLAPQRHVLDVRLPAGDASLPSGSEPMRLTLDGSERTRGSESQTLSFSLQKRAGSDAGTPLQGSPASQSLLIIDRQPMLVAMVLSTALEGTPGTAGQELATWGGLNSDWKLIGAKDSAPSGIFRLMLPPQTMGEAMERDKGAGDIAEDTPIDFRFSPPALITLKAEDQTTRYSEAPWNLRRLLNQVGSASPGATFVDARFELLYGLSCEVNEQHLRLAELATRLGKLRPRLKSELPWLLEKPNQKQRKAYEEYRLRWSRYHRRYLSRLAVMELLDTRKSGDLLLQDEVTFHLRHNAKLRYPIVDAQTGASVGSTDLALRIPQEADGLAGGVAWGFESQNIYEALWRDPDSTSGQLTKPHFSALGGWGRQTASFDSNLTTVTSETSMGRVSYVSIERRGRIGCLWNRAKHVIVYERSVVPRRRYMDGQEGDDQDLLLGRPVLRKVDEYIQILQDTRNYPEHGENNKPPCGFVLGSVFPKDIKIPVSSQWGSDYTYRNADGSAETGWQVPLWRRGANPDVYPKPTVHLKVAAHPDIIGGSPDAGGTGKASETQAVHLCELLDPYKLVFYTRTTAEKRAGGGRVNEDPDQIVDAWPPIYDIDYIDLTSPTAEGTDSSGTPSSGNALEVDLPDAPQTSRGYERFTYTLENGAQYVNLVEGRINKGRSAQSLAQDMDSDGTSPEGTTLGRGDDRTIISAVVRNVTMMRAAPVAVPQRVESSRNYGQRLGQLRDLEDELNGFFIELAQKLPREGELSEQAQKQALLVVSDIEKRAKTWGENVRDVFSGLSDGIGAAKPPWVETAENRVTNELTKARRGVTEGKQRIVNLASGLEKEINDAIARAADQTSIAYDEAIAIVDEQIERMIARAVPVSLRVIDLIDNIERPLQRIEASRGALDANRREIERLCASLPRTTGAQVAAEVEAIRASLRRESRALRDNLEALCGMLGMPVIAGITPTTRLPATIRTALQGLDTAIAQSISDVVSQLSVLWNEPEFTGVRNRIKDFTDQWNIYQSALDHAGEKVENWSDPVSRKLHDELHSLLPTVLPPPPVVVDVAAVQQKVSSTLKTFREAVQNVQVEPDNLPPGFSLPLPRPEDVQTALTQVAQVINYMGLSGQTNELKGLFLRLAKAELNRLSEGLQDALGDTQVPQFIEDLKKEVLKTGADLREVRERLTASHERARRRLEPYIETATEGINALRKGVAEAEVELQNQYQRGSETLRLLRAFGEAPRVPGLEFNRKQIAYYFQTGDDKVLMSPVTALVARGERDLRNLQALGIRLPTRQLLEDLIPDALTNFNVSDILPDFAGLRLDAMLPALKMPSLDRNNMVVTQGIDRQTMRAWVQAQVKVPVPSATLFSFGPVTVRLLNAAFSGRARIDVTPQGTSQETSAEIIGDWEVEMGGMKLVTFRRTELSFKEGNLNFALSPSNIEMTGAIEFLATVVRKASKPNSGLTLRPLSINGQVRGLEAVLDLPLPPLAAGAFALTGLRLVSNFGLVATPTPDGRKTDVEIMVGLSLASKTAPFTLMISLLAGGGWFESRVRYAPLSGRISSILSIGIMAGAMLAFNLGPIGGSVSVMFGISAEFALSNTGGSMTITTMMLIRGEVQCLGFVSVSITILLEAIYQNGTLIGRGFVEIKIKICWCFTFKFSKTVQCKLAGGGSANIGARRHDLDGSRARPRLVEGEPSNPSLFQTADWNSADNGHGYEIDDGIWRGPRPSRLWNGDIEPQIQLVGTPGTTDESKKTYFQDAAANYCAMFA